MPKVSVIVPVFGVEKYIERCARSLFAQTLNDIEYIFVDDCTNDKSIEILEGVINDFQMRLLKEGKTIRVERLQFNRGLAYARWYGLQFATGEYIIHCDSDDWVDINAYKIMYQKAMNDSSDVVIADYVISDGICQDKYAGCITSNRDKLLNDMLSHKVTWAVWNKLVKRELYESVSVFPKRSMGEDMVIVIQLIYFSKQISYVNEKCYYYYVNPQSLSHSIDLKRVNNCAEEAIENANLIQEFFSDKKLKFNQRIALTNLLFQQKMLKCPVLKDSKCLKEWRALFSWINKYVLLTNVPLKSKFKYIYYMLFKTV